MSAVVRAGLAAVLALLVCLPAFAAEKAFQRDELATAAIRLEAEIKKDTGQVKAAAATLRRDADAAFQRKDFRSGLQLLGQIVAVAPADSATWLRIARTILQIRPADDRETALLLERASTAAYIAYRRTTSRSEEADALVILGHAFADRKLWRPALDALRLSLDLREVADVREQYEKLRAEHGFRLLDYSVEADAVSPRACFQFSEGLPGKPTDLSPFVAVGGIDRPALSADEKQLCVEGLEHGERYTVTLRAGLPSAVKETLAKSADFTIYIPDHQTR
jgi:uncharacterized protein YfaS (alpha-2-macroglobulin family)